MPLQVPPWCGRGTVMALSWRGDVVFVTLRQILLGPGPCGGYSVGTFDLGELVPGVEDTRKWRNW